MKENPERIVELPGKQVAVTINTDIPDGGLVGFIVLIDGTINMTLLFDQAAGVAFPVIAGQVVVARIKQINSGGTLVAADIIGLA